MLNAGLLWTFLLRKPKSVASSREEAVSAGTLGIADSAQGKPLKKILGEDLWGLIRWETL